MEDKFLESKVEMADEEIKKSLKELAVFKPSDNLFFEYLYLVLHSIQLYEEFEADLAEGDYESAFKCANFITSKIELEKMSGVLKVK